MDALGRAAGERMNTGGGAPLGPTELEATTPWVRRWLRAEGLAAFAAALAAWVGLGADWWWFGLLLLTPDVSMIGYVAGPHAGAVTHNVVHNWATAIVVGALGVGLQAPGLVFGALILIGHVGVDRLMGYGLKYPTAFADTHLGRIGRR